jgi:transcriptional regulator with XRE-family HTH domain
VSPNYEHAVSKTEIASYAGGGPLRWSMPYDNTNRMAKRSPMAVDVVLGENIRTARLAAGLSQTDLGRACGVTFQQIQKYENGTNRIGGSRLMQIAEALKTPAATLLPSSQKHAGTPKHRAPAILQDRIGMDIVKVWERLKPEHRIALRDLVHAIASR